MNKIIVKCILIFAVITSCLMSCSQFTPEVLDKYQKGMAVSQTIDISPVSPKTEFNITIPSDPAKFIIHVYVLSLGDYKSDYFLAFRNDKLVYWGYPHEFARSSDPYLNEIGKIAVEEYLKIK
ncbi:MAG: hypothetical protein JST20_06715 [Bacteroidetes bacterium]|nr:hypothetical protein [Bacteroidota bacterium]